MKKPTLVVLACLFFFSCEGDYEKKSKGVAGAWTIQNVSYSDDTGVQNKNGDLGRIVFGEAAFDNTVYTRQQGVQIIEGKGFKFELAFSFSSSDVDIMYLREVRKALPKVAMGRAQVYHFDRINSNKLELFVDTEEDFATGELRKNVRYVLVR